MINLQGHEQEPLFPTSNTERQQMQEELIDILGSLQQKREEKKREDTKRRGEIADLEKRAAKLQDLLRSSRPRK